MTDLPPKSEKKIIALDLDTDASPKQIILTQPEQSKSLAGLTKPIKPKKVKGNGSDKPKKIKASGDTSIIDSILKKNKVDPVKLFTVSGTETKDKTLKDTQEPKKKMILDLNSGEQIITDDIKLDSIKITDPEPKLQFVPEKPKATIILKSEAKKQKQTGGNITPPETQFKLDTLFNIDTVCTGLHAQCNATASTPNSRSRHSASGAMGLEFSVGGSSINQTQSVASIITEPCNHLPSFSPPSYSSSIGQNATQKPLLAEASVGGINYAKELTEIDAQLAKVRAKLAKRGPDAKYLEMQTKLEERRAKYIRRQQRQEAGGNKSKPIITVVNPIIPEPKISESITPATTNSTSGLAQLFKRKTPSANGQTNVTQPDLLDEVNMELRKAKDMLTNIEKTSSNETVHATQQPLSSRKVIKEQGTSIFAVPSELTSMREKKEHLLAEQRKISDRIAHRQKQIDKIKTWQREVEKMNELQAEKQRIFELQQDLKRLEKQQYEQDQKLKGQMYHIRKMAHSKSNELKRLDMIDTFKAVKQRAQSVPLVANNTQIQTQTQTQTQTHRTEINNSLKVNNSLSAATQSGFGGKLRAAINSLFAGERVMFTKNNTIPAPIKQIAPQEPLIITEDAKSGLEYRTATPVNDDNSLMHPFIPPAQEIVDVINMAKQADNASNIQSNTETQISQHQVNVFRDYFCDKVGISKKGISKCFDLMPNKDETHTAILVNAYKELCDEIRFG
jgi:hypothetical protein